MGDAQEQYPPISSGVDVGFNPGMPIRVTTGSLLRHANLAIWGSSHAHKTRVRDILTIGADSQGSFRPDTRAEETCSLPCLTETTSNA